MWLSRLNRHAMHFDLEGSTWEVLGWSYQAHLASNVPHRHTYFEACLVGNYGAGIFTNAGEELALAPGTFFLARPGVVHQISNTQSEEMELYWVCFSLPDTGRGEIGALLRAFSGSDVVYAPAQETLAALWKALLALVHKSSIETSSDVLALRLMAQSVLLEIAQIGAASSAPTIPPAFVETAAASSSYSGLASNHSGLARLGVQYVHDNLERALTPDEIARHLAVSRRQVTRLFSAYTGVPPALYIERARIDRAQGLLRAGTKSIKEIAHIVGYSDVHHFSRVFTRVTGTSPARFREGGLLAAKSLLGPHIPKVGQLV
jgi:AraC family L-rhamnose operon transcriptional activator RhaR